MKRQPIEWDKIFEKHIPHMGLVSRIYKELLQLNKKTTQLKTGKVFRETQLQRIYTNDQ